MCVDLNAIDNDIYVHTYVHTYIANTFCAQWKSSLTPITTFPRLTALLCNSSGSQEGQELEVRSVKGAKPITLTWSTACHTYPSSSEEGEKSGRKLPSSCFMFLVSVATSSSRPWWLAISVANDSKTSSNLIGDVTSHDCHVTVCNGNYSKCKFLLLFSS